MKGYLKAIIAGAVIIGLGLAVLLVALGLNNWTFSPEFTTEEYVSGYTNHALLINLDAGNLKVEYHDEDDIKITYPVAKGYNTEITEKNGTLSINGNKHKWYFIAWGVTIPETVVKIPRDAITDVKVVLNAGKIDMAGGAYSKIDVEVNAGTFEVGQVTGCYSFNVELNAGTVRAISGVEADNFGLEVNAGSAYVKRIDTLVATIEVNAGSADVSFAGEETDYKKYVKVNSGSCKGLGGGDNGISTLRKITAEVNAGSLNATFLG